MGQGSIIGYEINEKTCQISFYNDQELEPDTLEVDSDNYQIPLIIGKLRDTWAYGKEAKRLVTIKEGFTVTRLLSKSLAGDKIEFGEETYDAVWLLSQFIQMSLQPFPEIEGIVFTVPALTEELAQMLYNYAQYKGITLPALGDLSKFPDGDEVSDWAQTAMSWANGLGAINGYEDNTLRPGGNTTRAEAASMIMGLATKLVSIPA